MNFPSIIIVGYNPQDIDKKIEQIAADSLNDLNPNNPDVYRLNEDSGWSIDQVREIKKFLSRKPMAHSTKIVIIYDAHNLQSEAQNALLKSLEEPPQDALIILTTNNIKSLLPTVISRCRLIKIKSKIIPTDDQLLQKLPDTKSNLELSNSLALTRDNALQYFENQVVLYQQLLPTHPEYAPILKKLIKCIQMSKANLDPKNILDWFLLS